MLTSFLDLYVNGFSYSGVTQPVEAKKLSWNHIHDLEDLAGALTTDEMSLQDWQAEQKEIKTLFSQREAYIDEVDVFLKTLMEWGVAHNPEKTIAFLLELVGLSTLQAVAKLKTKQDEVPFEDIFDWAKERQELCPLSPKQTFQQQLQVEWRKFRPFALYFIPNLINIFLGAFNFLETNKKYTSLWEKHLLLEIVYKFFLIPYCLVKVLQPLLVVTTKVYAVAALIIASVGTFFAVYQRWFKPLSDEIVNCANLDKKFEQGYLEPKVGQTKELASLIEHLSVGKDVLLLGRSGEGKTALVHHLIQLNHEGKLPPQLQRTHYEIDGGLLISNVSFGHAELINQTREQIAGYEGQVRIILNEFFQIVRIPNAFLAFKDRFLDTTPRPQFIACMTFKEFKELEKLDLDGSFRRRVETLAVESSSDDQNRLILTEFINRVAPTLSVTEDAIEKVLELSDEEDQFLPDLGRPSKALKIMTSAIGHCEVAFSSFYMSKELAEAQQEELQLKMKIVHQISADDATMSDYRAVRQKIKDLSEELEKHKQQAQKVKKLLNYQHQQKEHYYELTHQLAKAPQNPTIAEDVKKMYLLLNFYGIEATKKVLQSEIDKVKDELDIQIDADLVQQVYDEKQAAIQKLNAQLNAPVAATPVQVVAVASAEEVEEASEEANVSVEEELEKEAVVPLEEVLEEELVTEETKTSKNE